MFVDIGGGGGEGDGEDGDGEDGNGVWSGYWEKTEDDCWGSFPNSSLGNDSMAAWEWSAGLAAVSV